MVMVKVGDRYVRSRGPNKQPKPSERKKGEKPKNRFGYDIEPKGRPKGSPNKVGAEAKKMFMLAFEGIGGLKRLIFEADQNPWDFYKLYAKLIPMNIQGSIDVDVNLDGNKAREQLEAALINVINARRTGSQDPAVVVDGERVRDFTPQLVLPSPSRANTTSTIENRPALAELAVPGGTRRGKD